MKDIAIYILAGGNSSRMGEDKCLLPYRGHTLLEEIIDMAKVLSPNIYLVSQNPAHEHFGIPMIHDLIPKQGPVGGIDAILQQSKFTYNVIVSCDMPFVNSSGLQLLLDAVVSHQIALFENTEAPIIFPMVVHKNCRDTWRALLLSQVRKMREVISTFDSTFVNASSLLEKNIRFFENINTPDDYQSIKS